MSHFAIMHTFCSSKDSQETLIFWDYKFKGIFVRFMAMRGKKILAIVVENPEKWG